MTLNEKDLKKVTKKGKLGKEIFITSKKEGGYTAYFRDFPNIVTQGETVKEARKKLWNTVYDMLKYFTANKQVKEDGNKTQS